LGAVAVRVQSTGAKTLTPSGVLAVERAGVVPRRYPRRAGAL
jgi:hypothetical protein